MFEIGERIVYGNNGVCIVEEITKMDLKGVDNEKLYYRLTSAVNPGSKFFTPVDNDKVVMRRMLTKSEAEDLIKAVPSFTPIPVPDDKMREELYKEVIRACDPKTFFRMIITLHNRKEERVRAGKKNTSVDERYFKQIENNLYSELALALGTKREDMVEYIKTRING